MHKTGVIGIAFAQLVLQDRSVELEVVQKLKDDVRILSGQLANVQFSYRDPVKNFDRTKVKGVVAKLIKVKDPSTMTALEVSIRELTHLFLSLGGAGNCNCSHFFTRHVIYKKLHQIHVVGCCRG